MRVNEAYRYDIIGLLLSRIFIIMPKKRFAFSFFAVITQLRHEFRPKPCFSPMSVLRLMLLFAYFRAIIKCKARK